MPWGSLKCGMGVTDALRMSKGALRVLGQERAVSAEWQNAGEPRGKN
jgi:hypothetical protein